jgi:hypothetical protein
MRNGIVSPAHFCLWVSLAVVGAVDCGGSSTDPGNGVGGGSGPGVTVPGFPGAGTTAGDPLRPGSGPGTARDCGGGGAAMSPPTQVITRATQCFYSSTTITTTSTPSATIEQITEVIDGKTVLHLRITFDPGFVDNTYGANAVGWNAPPATDGGKMPKPGKGHSFNDLVGSDHVELELNDASGALALHFKLDYISADPSRPCGYGTLGVSGGEGKMLLGSASSILAASTSLDRNLNGCGYCNAVDSPATDAVYTPNPATPRWDYRVVYEVWIDAAAFGAAGPGDILLQNVHASPSKAATNTVSVKKGRCPPTWPECTPDIITEGLNCGDAGAGCPPGTIEYIISEGRTCVPPPISLPDGGLGCPRGYHLDVLTEGRFCLPD